MCGAFHSIQLGFDVNSRDRYSLINISRNAYSSEICIYLLRVCVRVRYVSTFVGFSQTLTDSCLPVNNNENKIFSDTQWDTINRS